MAAGLPEYQREFIQFMLECGVLRFGQFRTKSGRETPYFINTGRYDDGAKLRRLGQFYAQALVARLGTGFDVLYGPAYKGIPLVVATGIALAEQYGRAVPYVFNRKEAKDHGEGGLLVGHALVAGERLVIVDDVVTAGTSVEESVALLQGTGVQLTALVVSVDRQERAAAGPHSALQLVAQRHGLKAFAIVTLDELVAYLEERLASGQPVVSAELLGAIAQYRATYGARA